MPGLSTPHAWNPDDPSTVQLIACSEFLSAGEQMRTCTYEDLSPTQDRDTYSLPLVRASWQITVIETRTGKKRGTSKPFDGHYQECPHGFTGVYGPSGTLRAVPSSTQILDYVRPFVER